MRRLLILCLFLVGGLFQASASATSFHERECKESFDGKAGSAGQWDHNCWDYVSEDGKRWIGSSGEDSQADSDPAKPDPETAARIADCDDLICGKWRINQGGNIWQVRVQSSSDPNWEFEAVWIVSGLGFGYKVGDLDMRFNKAGDGFYVGETFWRNIIISFGWGPLTVRLQSPRNFIADTPGTGGFTPVGTQKIGLRLGPVPERSNPTGGSGTGFFVSSNGVIVTNNHVIDGADEISVTVPSGETYKAKVVAKSASTDLAVLKIDYQSKDYLTFANPGVTDIGDKVFTLGFPISDLLGKEVKYSEGVINSLSGIKGDATFFQISVPIQPGNSGGPLVNKAGKVVGIVTATAAVEAFYKATGSLPQNINWAVKGAYAALIVPSSGKRSHGPVGNVVKHTKRSVVFIQAK